MWSSSGSVARPQRDSPPAGTVPANGASVSSAAPPVPVPIELVPQRRRRRVPASPFRYFALFFFAVLILTPVYVLVVTSFKDAIETDPSHAWSLPGNWTLTAWDASSGEKPRPLNSRARALMASCWRVMAWVKP